MIYMISAGYSSLEHPQPPLSLLSVKLVACEGYMSTWKIQDPQFLDIQMFFGAVDIGNFVHSKDRFVCERRQL